jgi:FtsH-binding integral membrane protein
MQHIDTAYWLGLVITFVLPLLVGVVTTHVTNGSVQAVLLLAFSSINGFLVEYGAPHPDGYSVGSAVVFALVGFVMAVAAHFGLWKSKAAFKGSEHKDFIKSRKV